VTLGSNVAAPHSVAQQPFTLMRRHPPEDYKTPVGCDKRTGTRHISHERVNANTGSSGKKGRGDREIYHFASIGGNGLQCGICLDCAFPCFQYVPEAPCGVCASDATGIGRASHETMFGAATYDSSFTVHDLG